MQKVVAEQWFEEHGCGSSNVDDDPSTGISFRLRRLVRHRLCLLDPSLATHHELRDNMTLHGAYRQHHNTGNASTR